jgi:hypothetical protein
VVYRAAPPSPPPPFDEARALSLLRSQVLDRAASPQELETDLGALRAWVPRSGRGPRPERRRDRLEVASSLLRRLDLAQGAQVSLRVDLGAPLGVTVSARDLEASYFAERYRSHHVYESAWLSLAGELASGLSLHVARVAVTAELTDQRREHKRIVTRTQREHDRRDTVTVRYDPARFPRLARPLEPGPAGLTLPPGCELVGWVCEPGLLRLVVTSSAASVESLGPLPALVAVACELVDPSRRVVMLDGEAWPADLATEGEARRRGLPRGPSLALVGAVALIAAGLAAAAAGAASGYESARSYGRARDAEVERRECDDRLAALAPGHRERAMLSACVENRRESRAHFRAQGAERAQRAATQGGVAVVLLGAAGFLGWRGRRRA